MNIKKGETVKVKLEVFEDYKITLGSFQKTGVKEITLEGEVLKVLKRKMILVRLKSGLELIGEFQEKVKEKAEESLKNPFLDNVDNRSLKLTLNDLLTKQVKIDEV